MVLPVIESGRASDPAGAARLRAWLAEHAAARGDQVYIDSIDQASRIRFGEIHELTRAFARYLGQAGLTVNDRVALLANNSIEHWASYLGVMAYGATVCTVHLEMNAAHLRGILQRLEPRIVLYEPGLGLESLTAETPGVWVALGAWRTGGGSGLFAALHALRAPDGVTDLPAAGAHDDACICFTSGTQSTPKGVVLTYGELLDNVEPTAVAFGMTAADRVLDYRSYNWASAQILSGLAPLARGATVLMARKFSARRFFAWVRAHGATIAAGNPTAINMLMNRSTPPPAADLRSLRFMTSSSAPLLVEEWRRFEQRFGITIAQGYGSSETGWIAGSDERTRRIGSVGQPLAYHRLTVVDETGAGVPPGAVGRVELGHEPARAYRHLDADGTIGVDARGRIRTGDLGYLDADGYLYLTGREKELIIRGGVNVAPLEIDGVLLRCTGIVEAAAFGVPDPIHGEEIVACVVTQSGARVSEEDLIAHCAAWLPPAKIPKRIGFRAALPKTARGKLDRKTLRAEWLRETTSPGAP